jgi:LysM repeat protein
MVTLIGLAALKAHAEYEIRPGDTLSGLAKSQYGSFEKWKELYELNKPQIQNPDLIFPGQRLKLLEGDAGEMIAAAAPLAAQVAETSGGSKSDVGRATLPPHSKKKKLSEEWRLLPLQNWEKFVFKSDPAIDPDGFDRRSRVAKVIVDKTHASATISGDRIPIQGEIVGARTDFSGIAIGDQVFIRQDENLQIGKVYSITPGPEKIESERDGRVGFVYPIQGSVRLVGVRDGVFIGTVVSMSGMVYRNQLLIPEVKHLQIGKPIAASSAVEATVITPEADQDKMLGSQQLLFLDVGQSDGVKNGMVFRNFVHEDPLSKEEISSKDFLIESEIQVLETYDRFSAAMVIRSRSHLKSGDTVVALTDLKDLNRHQGMQTLIQDKASTDEINELDQMDSADGLGEKERQDLKQLESWTQPVPSDSASSLGGEDIQKVDLSPGRKPPTIGEELAPNDGTDVEQPKKPKKEPEPETAPAEEAPASDELPPSPEVEIAPEEKKPEEKTTEPSSAPEPTPTPSPAPEESDLPPSPEGT